MIVSGSLPPPPHLFVFAYQLHPCIDDWIKDFWWQSDIGGGVWGALAVLTECSVTVMHTLFCAATNEHPSISSIQTFLRGINTAFSSYWSHAFARLPPLLFFRSFSSVTFVDCRLTDENMNLISCCAPRRTELVSSVHTLTLNQLLPTCYHISHLHAIMQCRFFQR